MAKTSTERRISQSAGVSKRCNTCGKMKSVKQFYKRAKSLDGLQAKCNTCVRSKRDAWYAANPEKIREHQRRYELKRYFGITPEEYTEMEEAQGGLCFICRLPPLEGRCLDVDHDHETMKVRALLCSVCNRHLGSFEKYRADFEEYLANFD
jgi:hypothetical protein